MAEIYFKLISEYGEFDISEADIENLDLIPAGKSGYHVIQNFKSYSAKIITSDSNSKSYLIEINGNKYSMQLKDEHDILIEQMGFTTENDHEIKHLNAPMPGLILDVMVKKGDEIKKGESLFILEAMKMENVIKSPGDGVIKNVEVVKGESVDKGQLIIEML